MDYKRFGNTIFARVDSNEEIQEQVRAICLKENVKLARVEALGALKDFVIGVYDMGSHSYHANHFTGVYELASLHGTITTMNGEYYAHLHMSAGDATGKAVGGHLTSAVVSATCEIVITVIDGELEREFNPEIGLNQFKF